MPNLNKSNLKATERLKKAKTVKKRLNRDKLRALAKDIKGEETIEFGCGNGDNLYQRL